MRLNIITHHHRPPPPTTVHHHHHHPPRSTTHDHRLPPPLPTVHIHHHRPPPPIYFKRYVKKQTIFFLQTAYIWSTFSTDVYRYRPQTADILPLKKTNSTIVKLSNNVMDTVYLN
ncbi:hypothetical protein Hanom_Chr03g00206081 [Helianthus anomalus]